MKRIFFIIFVFVNCSLFAQRQEVGRFTWEFRNFPEENILEIEFKAEVPRELMYNPNSVGNTILGTLKESWDTAIGGVPQTVTGTPNNFIVRLDYRGRGRNPWGTYPDAALIRYLNLDNSNSYSKNIPYELRILVRNMELNRPGNYVIWENWDRDHEEYYWTGVDMSRGHRSFIASYIIYRTD